VESRGLLFGPWALRLFGHPVGVTQPFGSSVVIATRRRRFAVRRHKWEGRYLRLVLECPICGRRHLERGLMIRTRRDVRAACSIEPYQWCPTCRGPAAPARQLTSATRPS
jgi:hypothetical protein